MKIVRMKIDVLNPTGKSTGRIDPQRVDATTEADIARHKAADDADAMLDAAKFAPARDLVGLPWMGSNIAES